LPLAAFYPEIWNFKRFGLVKLGKCDFAIAQCNGNAADRENMNSGGAGGGGDGADGN